MEAVAGPPYVVAFQLDSNISVEFWMTGPESEAMLISIIFS